MKRVLVSLVVGAGLIMVLSGCAMVKAPVNGGWYTNLQASEGATSNVGASKIGEASCTSILGLIATGDASIDAAAKAAGITKIHHVDYKAESLLGIYSKYTVVVYGE